MPISKRVYCALPWYTIQFLPDGTYGCCCYTRFRAKNLPSSLEELMARWNSKAMIKLRTNLLEGRIKNTPCDSCYGRLFSTDHDIFGMLKHLPRYSKHNGAFEEYYQKANESYTRGIVRIDTPPLELYIFTSELCHLKCIMCIQNRDSKEFPTQNIKALVDEIGWEKIDRFGYVGGETFLTRDALDLLEFVASQDIKGACIYISTNGLLIYKHIGKLDKIENLFITVSIDGTGEVYEKIRVNAKWSNLLSNLTLLKEHKKVHPNWRININSVVMKSTYHSLIDMLKLAQSIGATIFFAPINGGHPEEDIFFNPGLLRDFSDFEKKVDEAIEYAKEINAFKSGDSLEKIKLYMDLRKKRFKKPLAKLITFGFSSYLQAQKPSLVYRSLRKGMRGILKIFGANPNVL